MNTTRSPGTGRPPSSIAAATSVPGGAPNGWSPKLTLLRNAVRSIETTGPCSTTSSRAETLPVRAVNETTPGSASKRAATWPTLLVVSVSSGDRSPIDTSSPRLVTKVTDAPGTVTPSASRTSTTMRGDAAASSTAPSESPENAICSAPPVMLTVTERTLDPTRAVTDAVPRRPSPKSWVVAE